MLTMLVCCAAAVSEAPAPVTSAVGSSVALEPYGLATRPWVTEVEAPPPFWTRFDSRFAWPVDVMVGVLYGIIFMICVYTVRHYWFTFNRLFGRQRNPYIAVDETDWPEVTVLIPCHNEEAVISTILDALLRVDYPASRLRITPVNDRSTDATREIIDHYAVRFPTQILPFHRSDGPPGKAAALKDAFTLVESDLALIFDADYVPGRDLIKRLVAPLLDPEVGAVMGRVVPLNTPRNLLTRLLDMERAGGYQVDQQARMNLDLIPQYGGTVGGVRLSALNSVGGWRPSSLTEDTDLTCRLVAGGWKVAYSNRYECYEEVPETWPVRIRQIKRWARGHTDAALRYVPLLLISRHLRWRERLDGTLLMGIYLMSPLLIIGWLIAIALFYLGEHALHGLVAILAVASYNTLGNFAAFFEIAAAVRLDGHRHRIRLLPLVLVGFLVSLFSTGRAAVSQLRPRKRRRDIVWHKTERFRENGLEAWRNGQIEETTNERDDESTNRGADERMSTSAPFSPRQSTA